MRTSRDLRPYLLQYGSALLGLAWGWSRLHLFMGEFAFAGILSVVLVGAGWAGLLRCRSRADAWTPRGCSASLVYQILVMAAEPFMGYSPDGSDIIRGIFLLTPLLFSMGYLARHEVWPAAIGNALFVSTSIAMLTLNGFLRSEEFGFFCMGVS